MLGEKIDWKEIGVYCGTKFDGTAVNISTGNGKVMIVSEDGMDYTKNLPTMVKELSKFPEMVFPAELELWIKGKHAPRATSAGVLNAKSAVENEKHIRANVYDMLYYEGKDLHNLPYSDRLKYLAKLKDTKHVVKSSRTLCTTEAQVRKAIDSYSNKSGSEGAMLKLANFKYELDKKTKFVLKFKKELQLRAKVIKINKVAGSKGVYSYVCALSGPDGLHYIGKTFNTKIKADVGDTINVSFVDVYAYEDKETGKKWANWYAPHVIGKDTKSPDSISKAWKMAEETTGVKETKKEPKVKDFSSKKKRWVAQFHIRGGSVHIDFRTEENGYLLGFTLAPAVSEKFLKEIETHWELKKEKGVRSLYWDNELAYQFDTKGNVTKKASLGLRSKIYRWHVKFMKNPDLWKMDMKTGEELKRKTKTGEIAQKIYAIKKKQEPMGWLDLKGVTPPKEVEDVPGGTALFPGVFVEIDAGTYDMGAKKVYYHEYFLKGSKWKGRFIFRQVAGLKDTKKHLIWLYWKADTKLPYVLSRRAVRESWFPKGYSALPEDLENKVPSELNYWKTGLTGKQRTERRDELILKLKETLKKREMSALELDFIKPLKPYKGDDFTNEFFSVKDLKLFDCKNKIIGPKVDGIRCVSGYTKIYVKDIGFTSIRDIKIGAVVLTNKGNFRNVTDVHRRQIEKDERVFEFQTYLGEKFKITQGHEILIVKNGTEVWTPVEQVSSGDWVHFPKPNFPVDELPFGKKLILETTGGYTKEVVADSDFYRFLGFWVGNGISNLHNHIHRVGICFNAKQKNKITRYKSIVHDIFKIDNIGEYEHNGCLSLYWTDAGLLSWLHKYFRNHVYDAFKGKTVPNWFFSVSTRNIKAFLDGWYDSDGKQGRITRTITTKEKLLASRMHLVCVSNGICSGTRTFRANNGKNYYELILPASNRRSRFSSNGNLIVQIKECNELLRTGRNIEVNPRLLVYNLQVDKDESYCTNVASLHNCQIHKQGNSVKCYSAYGNQFALHKLGNIPNQIREINAHSFILDGELYLAGKGHNEVHEAVTTDGSSDFRFMAFDILHANGVDLENKPLLERKKYLNCIKPSEHISKEPIARFDSDKELIRLVEKLRPDFEGAVIKDLSSTYFEPKKLWKMIFIEKQFKELDALDHNSLGDMKIVCSRLERKVQEGRAIPISFDKLSSISARVNALLDAASYSGEFLLSRRYWKGATVVRGQEVEDFHIKFPGHMFHLDGNPIDKDVTATCFRRESGQNEYFIAGEYEPGTEINPNKKIKANIEILDKGSIKVIETGPKVTKVKFSGTKLKGIHTFRRTTPLGTIWSMIKGDSSKGSMSRNISFQFKDFMVKVGQKTNKLIEDIKFPYIKEAVAFSEGTWHNRFYPWDKIREAAPLLVGKPIGTPGIAFEIDSINDGSEMVLEHSDGILENVGNVRKVWIDDKNKKLDIEFEIIDTSTGKDCALLIENEKIPAVSVRIEENDPVFENGVEVSTGILSWPHTALVRYPAVDNALIKID